MTVYVVFTSYASDFDNQTNIKIFGTYEKAKAYFDEVVKDEKENDHLMNSSNLIIEETETSFTIYEDGNFCEDNFQVWIKEQEVL